MKSILLYACFLLLTVNTLWAQNITGVVKDAQTQKGISYVNIGIPARGFAVLSDDEGAFSFKITDEKENDTIQIYCLGYQKAFLSVKQFKDNGQNNLPIYLKEAVYQLATTTVRPNDYDTKVMGCKNIADLKCMNLSSVTQTDTATIRKYKEKGLNEKSIGVEIGNKIKIDKGQQTFIDRIQFKTCLGPNDTAIYRVNIYSEGKTLERHMTPIGMIKVVTTDNAMKQPVIVKTIGKTEVHDIDLSKQNIEVSDDFIIALECIYASNKQMNIGADPSVFGSTDLLIRASIMDEWFKVPLIDITFISATVTYKKKKGFFARLFD